MNDEAAKISRPVKSGTNDVEKLIKEFIVNENNRPALVGHRHDG